MGYGGNSPRTSAALLSYRKMILFAFALLVGYNSGMKNDSEQQAAKQWEALAEWRREHPEAAADIALAIGAKARQQAALEERRRLARGDKIEDL